MQENSKRDIVVAAGLGSAALALEPELAEAVSEVIAAAESDNTRKADGVQVRKFEAWCARRGASALPATPAVVAIYLTDMAKNSAKVATVSLALSAISARPQAGERPV